MVNMKKEDRKFLYGERSLDANKVWGGHCEQKLIYYCYVKKYNEDGEG